MWALEESPLKGRTVVAKRKILAGETVLEEPPPVCIVSWKYQLAACQNCLCLIKENQAFAHNSSDPYRYCSEVCLRADAPVHLVEMDCVNRLRKMKGFRSLENNESQKEREIEPLRLIIRAAAQKKVDGSSASSKPERVPLLGKANKWQHLMGLEAHEGVYVDEDLDYIMDISKRMEILLKVCGMDVRKEEIVHLIRAIASNAHSIKESSSAGADLTVQSEEVMGLGLFPMTSMINHSCQANCAHYFMTGNKQSPKVVMRALKDIEVGEELCYSYVALFQSTAARRATLLRSYQFECVCPRCLSNSSEIGALNGDAVIDRNPPDKRVMVLMQKVNLFLEQGKERELFETLRSITEAVDGCPPLSADIFYAHNCVLSSSSVMLHGSASSSPSQTEKDKAWRMALVKMNIQCGLLALGAIKTFIEEPNIETAKILLSMKRSLDIACGTGGGEVMIRLPLQSNFPSPSPAEALKRLYMATKADLTVFDMSEGGQDSGSGSSTIGNAAVEQVLEAASKGLEPLIGTSDTPTHDAVEMLRDLFAREGQRVLAICRNLNNV